jgi:hypothetical protein
MPYMLSAPVDLKPVEAQTRIERGRLQASSKIENSVVTTGSNNWYRSRYSRSEKAKPAKKSRASHMTGAPRCVTKEEIIGV